MTPGPNQGQWCLDAFSVQPVIEKGNCPFNVTGDQVLFVFPLLNPVKQLDSDTEGGVE